MNYEKLYFAFIEKYKNQVFEDGVYTEVHHIIPRHAGGDDSKENLIRLTFRQHVFAHRLLWKSYKNHNDLIAWTMMSGVEVDKKIASLKAIGRANAESGFLDSIRHLANNEIQRQKVRELGLRNLENGVLARAQKLAKEAWTGSNHSEEWKENKSAQMKEWSEKEENYKQLMEMNSKAVEVNIEKSKKLAESVLINAERNEEFLHKSSSRSKNKFVSPEGFEFDSPIFAAGYYGNVDYYTIENWCKRSQHGWSRKPKAEVV